MRAARPVTGFALNVGELRRGKKRLKSALLKPDDVAANAFVIKLLILSFERSHRMRVAGSFPRSHTVRRGNRRRLPRRRKENYDEMFCIAGGGGLEFISSFCTLVNSVWAAVTFRLRRVIRDV